MSKDKQNGKTPDASPDLAALVEVLRGENNTLSADLSAARNELSAYEPAAGANRFHSLFPLAFCMIRGVVAKTITYRDGTLATDIASVNVPLATMGHPNGTGMTIPGVRIVFKQLPHNQGKAFDVVFPSSGSMNTFKHSMLSTSDDESASVDFQSWKRDLLTKFVTERREAAARGEKLISLGSGKGLAADDSMLTELGITIPPPAPKPEPVAAPPATPTT